MATGPLDRAVPRAAAALVLDDLVATWLNQHCGNRLRPNVWSTHTYEKYLDLMHAWAGSDCTAPELETLIFVAEESRRKGNQ